MRSPVRLKAASVTAASWLKICGLMVRQQSLEKCGLGFEEIWPVLAQTRISEALPAPAGSRPRYRPSPRIAATETKAKETGCAAPGRGHQAPPSQRMPCALFRSSAGCFLLSSEPDESARAGHESQHRRHYGRIARASREPFAAAAARLGVRPRAPAASRSSRSRFAASAASISARSACRSLLLSLLLGTRRRLDVFDDLVVDFLPSRQQQFLAFGETLAGWQEKLLVPVVRMPSVGRRPEPSARLEEILGSR